jgi:acyl carrier protein
VRCGLSSDVPRTTVDEAGVCSVCRSYEAVRDQTQAYFKTTDDLWALFSESRRAQPAAYDCLMLYSGGKDSTYALCRLVEAGLSVRAFTLDNGFISTAAQQNIRRVANQLNVPLDVATPPGMNEILRDSLARFSNVCNGCFKTIYTLGMLRARELGIRFVVTGLSRGQLFETRLSVDLFRDGRGSADAVDAAVLAARKAYHRTPDVVSRVIDTAAFQRDEIFDDVRVIDFYRYCDVAMDEMLSYLDRTVPWVRPADTGRSSNCLINDTGIYVHRLERGFHNYAQAYSWDVRLGHKTRQAALEELDDNIDPERVRRMLLQIGYDERRLAPAAEATGLIAFYVASEDVMDAELRRQLAEHLPVHLIPQQFQRVASIPLTINGKVDEAALLRSVAGSGPARPHFVAPSGEVAEFLARVWEEELDVEAIGASDSFFALGGTSLIAMQVIVRVSRTFDVEVPLATLFTHPRLADLAHVVEDLILADDESADSQSD